MTTPAPEQILNHIAGDWAPSRSGRTAEDTNPADTREVVARFPLSNREDAEAAVTAAAGAFDAWRRTPIGKRAKALMVAGDYLEANAERFATEMSREEGKSVALAKDEFLRAAQTLRFYAVEGQTFGGETFPQDDPDMIVYSAREPLGVVTAISPWNFPVSIPARKIAPALITGNTVVFKPSSDAPLSGFRLAEALVKGGLPKGAFNFITGAASEVGPAITEDPRVRAVTFTGSTSAGERIHKAVPLTTRTQMELGGKNPLVVMEDADLDLAVDLAVKGGLSLSGQACTGTSRIIVASAVLAAFTEKLVAKVRTLRIGSGLTPGMDLGPLATESQLRTVLGYIEAGKREAKLLVGGERLTGEGFEHGCYVTPAVFGGVTPACRIAREEIFGPVLAILEAKDFAAALAMANDTEYGLAASICTKNARYAHEFAKESQAGSVKVNRTTTGNLVNAPFGGMKRSSTATFRESGRTGLEFFTQVKTVYRGA